MDQSKVNFILQPFVTGSFAGKLGCLNLHLIEDAKMLFMLHYTASCQKPFMKNRYCTQQKPIYHIPKLISFFSLLVFDTLAWICLEILSCKSFTSSSSSICFFIAFVYHLSASSCSLLNSWTSFVRTLSTVSKFLESS